MNDLIAIMKRLTLLQDFIDQSRGQVCRVFVYVDKEGDLKGPVGFLIVSDSSLWVAANGIDDSIEVAIELSAPTEAGITESISRGRWTSVDGRSLVAAWLLTNQRGYTDGLQLCLLGPNEGLVVAQFLAAGSTLSLKTSSAPAAWSGSLGRSEPASDLLKRGDELARQLAVLESCVEDCAALSDVLYRRVHSVVMCVILVFGERALSVWLRASETQAELLDYIPRDCESAARDDVWRGLLGSRLMWLWCLTDVTGRTTGLQAEFWGNGEPTGTRQVLVINEELKVFELE